MTPPNDPERDLERLLREEPFVRGLARELCVSGGADPEEVAQQAWVQALEHGGRQVDKPRSWLARIVRNVASNLARGERRRRSREAAVAGGPAHDAAGRAAVVPSTAVPSSAELMLREERRRQLVELVDALPAVQREVVLLRYFEGLAPRKVAARLGVPVDQVHNLQRRGLEQLRKQLDAAARKEGEVDRRAFLLPLVGFGPGSIPAPPPVANPWPVALLPGAIVMTTKTKMTAVVAALLALAAYVAWPGGETPGTVPAEDGAHAAPTALSVDLGTESPTDDAAAANAVEADREIVGSDEPAARYGTVRVTVVRRSDAGPVPVGASVVKFGADTADYREAVRKPTDNTGVVEFSQVEPGIFRVWGDRASGIKRVEVLAGVTKEVELEYRSTKVVRGRVIDQDNQPVAGADLEVSLPGLVGRDPEILGVSDAEGRFEIRAAPDPSVIGARKLGYRSSFLQMAWNRAGDEVEIEIVLQAGGGVVDGHVFGPDGEPVENALVKVGAGAVQGVHVNLGTDEPTRRPALVRTDASGRFVACGIHPGDAPVEVRAAGLALWTGVCVVTDYSTVPLRVDLRAGAVLHGTVLDQDGGIVSGASISVGTWDDFGRRQVRSGSDGTYRLAGLAGGETEVDVRHDDAGKLEKVVHLEPAEVREFDLRMDRGIELSGRVLDEKGEPVQGVWLEIAAQTGPGEKPWMTYGRTDADGRFSLANCLPGRLMSIGFSGDKIEPLRMKDIDPAKGELDVRVVRAAPPSVYIRGRVFGADGRPCAGAQIQAFDHSRRRSSDVFVTKADGVFEFGPVLAAKWRIGIEHEEHATPEFVVRELGVDAVWDMGVVHLDRGGRAVFTAAAESIPLAELTGMIATPDFEHRWTVQFTGPREESKRLRTGKYVAQIWGAGAAAQSIPFEVTAGRDAEITVLAMPGVSHRFEFSLEDPNATTYGGNLKIHRDGVRVVDHWLRYEKDKAWNYTVALQPGVYRVSMTGSFSAQFDLTVTGDAAAGTKSVPVVLR